MLPCLSKLPLVMREDRVVCELFHRNVYYLACETDNENTQPWNSNLIWFQIWFGRAQTTSESQQKFCTHHSKQHLCDGFLPSFNFCIVCSAWHCKTETNTKTLIERQFMFKEITQHAHDKNLAVRNLNMATQIKRKQKPIDSMHMQGHAYKS